MTKPMVDWPLAVTVGAKVAGAGPEVDAETAAQAVAQLRADAVRSTGLVRDFTGLDAAEHRPEAGAGSVLVVDRPGWIRANAESFATILEPLTTRLAEKAEGPGAGVASAIGSRVTGTEVGLVLGFLGGKVLGQFDPFYADQGRLLLVAPNIVHVEREISADPDDFRLWVCLHEETHRVQFTAVPWMREHLLTQVRTLLDSMEPSVIGGDLAQRISEAIRGGQTGGSILEAISTPEQRAVIDDVTGMMSLLEGHADVVMDGVGPEVIGSVDEIRKAFNQRRQGVGVLDKLLRRVLGLDAKMAQYRDGAAFVRAVVDTAGMAQFNAVWTQPDHLPSKSEIHDPQAWMTRVLG
jgi:coenzyme F420 biosynthesis associated uncharacterized protein